MQKDFFTNKGLHQLPNDRLANRWKYFLPFALVVLFAGAASAQTVTKQLYLSDPAQALDRVHPGLVSPIDNTTATSTALGTITCGPASPFATPSVPFSTPTDISPQFGAAAAETPDMAVHRSIGGVETVHMVFTGKATGAAKVNIYYSSKTGAGAWTTPVRISSDNFNQDAQLHPSIAVDANNKAYVVYAHKNTVTAPIDAKINIYYVTNTSGSWSTPVRISNGGFGQDAKTPEIALDASGKAYIVYAQKNSDIAPVDAKVNIYYVTNTSGSWSAPVRVSNDGFGQDAQLNPAIAVDAANKAHVAYTHKNSDIAPVDAKINAYYVTNTSGSWSAPARISIDNVSNDVEPNPSIAVDASDKPHVVYSHKNAVLVDGQINVYYTNKISGSWTTPVDLSNDVDVHASLNPDLAVSCTGIVRVAFSNNGDNIYYTENSGSGGAWTALLDINPLTAPSETKSTDGNYPSVAVTSHNLHVVYQDKHLTLSGVIDVWHTSSSLAVPGLPVAFTQTPVVCSNLVIPSGGTVSVTLHTNVTSGSMPVNPAVTVTLAESPGSIFITLTNPTYTPGAGSAGVLTFTGTMPSATTIDAGNAVVATVSTSLDVVAFTIQYDSDTKPSKVEFVTSTFINVDAVGLYTAAYPGGTSVSQMVVGVTYYVRIPVSDPFGTTDVNGVDLVITPNIGAPTNVTLGAGNVVSTSGCIKTYEYAFTVAGLATSFNFSATAKEGYEGTVTDVGNLNNVPVLRIDAINDALTVENGSPGLINVLSNDLGTLNTASLTIVTQPTSGSLQIGVGGNITYLPNGSFAGTDTYVYQICNTDAVPVCDNATVTVTVLPNLNDVCSVANQPQTYYMPFPENATQLREAMFQASNNFSMSNVVHNIISFKTPYPNTVITYDHWEDGYETDITQPTQSTTKIWGDGNLTNGVAPGYPTDVMSAGASILLDNNFIWNPRTATDIYYDGKDKVYTSADVAISKITGDAGQFNLQSAKTDVIDVSRFGKLFTLGLGEIVGIPYFAYASLFVRAATNGTVVNIDLDHNGTIDLTQNLNEGEVWFYQGDPAAAAIATATDVKPGAIITSNFPVGVDLLFGGNDNFGTRNLSILPGSFYGDTYYSPVPSTNLANAPTVVYFVNNLSSAITVNWNSGLPSSGTVSVPANGYASLTLSANAGYKFENLGGQSFTAVQIMDADAGGSTWDWAITLIQEDQLTDFTSVAWAPGSADFSLNDNPIWVTPVANTTLYIKHDGDLVTASPTLSPCGLPYDIAVTLNALQYYQVKDASDNDQSGTALYTCDGVQFAAVYGEDAATATTANPNLDVGTTLSPKCLDANINAIDNFGTTPPNTPIIFDVAANDIGFLCTVNPLSVSITGVLQPANGTIVLNPDGTITYTPDNGFTGEDVFEYQICSVEFPATCDIAKVYVTITSCAAAATEDIINGKVFLEQLTDDGTYNSESFVDGVGVDLYADANCNSIIDGSEPVVQSTVSDPSGNYSFSVINGYFARDNFDPTASFTGNDGSVNWTNNWTEVGDNAVINTGDVQIIADAAGTNAIRLDGNANGITRSLTFSAATAATLKFSFRRQGMLNAGETCLVQVNGTTVYTITDGDAVGTDNYYQDIILTLGSFNANASNSVQFITNASVGTTSYFWIDDVELIYKKASVCFIAKVNPANTGGDFTASLLNQQVATFTALAQCDNDNYLGVLANMTAVDDAANAAIDVPVVINVIGNDLPGTAGPTTVTTTGLPNQPANGTVTVNMDGTITYTPNPGFTGTDDFEYQVCSALDPLKCDIAVVTVTVSCISIPLQNTITGKVFNDVDIDGTLDVSDGGKSGVSVKLFEDTDGDGVLDVGEPLLQTEVSSSVGAYQFDITPPSQTNTYLDQFATNGSGTGSNGTVSWTALPWAEIGEATNLGGGIVQVITNQLRISGNAVATVFGASRTANLTGAFSATLSFAYTETTLDIDANDYVDVEVSTTAGGPWTLLKRYTGADGNQTGTSTFDISAYMSATTTVRFVSSGSTNLAATDIVFFDNVQISYPSLVTNTYRDEFTVNTTANQTAGTTSWAANSWTEIGEANGFATANITLTAATALEITGSGTTTVLGAMRTAPLSGAGAASVSFTATTVSLDDANDWVEAQVASSPAGPWTALQRVAGPSNGITTSYSNLTIPAALISATTTIRFVSSGVATMATGDQVDIDNVQITYNPASKYIVQLAQPIPTGFSLTTPTPSPTGIRAVTFPSVGGGSCQQSFGLAGADLAITKVGTPDPVASGSNITYTITVTNNGPSDAAAVSMNDVLPVSLSLVSATPSVGSWTAPNWTVGTLANGASANIVIVATVSAATPATTLIINTATVTSTTADPVSTNNMSKDTATVICPTLTVTPGSNSPVCAGGNLNLTVTGSTATMWSWTGPNSFTSTSQNPTITGVTTAGTGTYNVTITTLNGCTASASTAVTINALPSFSIVETDASCTSDDEKVLSGAAATLTVTAGFTSYSWNNGLGTGNPKTANPTSTTTYTVTVTNASGCTSTDFITVTVVSAPTVSIVETDASCTANDGKVLSGASATLTATAGFSSYSWDNSLGTGNPKTVNPVATTTYNVTATNADGCTATASSTVTVVAAPTVSIVETDASCTINDGQVLSGGAATLTATAGFSSYSWDNALGTGNPKTVNPTATTTYNVTATNADGCTATAASTVTVVAAPTVSIVETDASCTINDGKVLSGAAATLTATAGFSNYSWDNALGTGNPKTVNPTATTTYNVTATNADGCTATAASTVTVVSAPDFTLAQAAVCPGATDYAIISNLTNAVPATSMAKVNTGSFFAYPSPPNITPAAGLVSGSNTITVKNADGCETAKIINIIITPANGCTPMVIEKL